MQYDHPEHSHAKAEVIKNHYEPKSVMRTMSGVMASILLMGVPVGLVEFLRPGGDQMTWMISFVCVIVGAVLALVSVNGTLKD